MTKLEKSLADALRRSLIQWAYYAELRTQSVLATDETPEATEWRRYSALLQQTTERKQTK